MLPHVRSDASSAMAPKRAQDVCVFRVEQDGLASLLRSGRFSDIVVELADGEKLSAHRILLASASDVLSAKFESQMADAAVSTWRPDVGSAPAWRWIIGWIYCLPEPLPLELFVEVLVIADYFQLQSLVSKITALDLGDRGKRHHVALQILEVERCPEVLAKVAAMTVPCVALDDLVVQKLCKAKQQNAVLFMRHFRCEPLPIAKLGKESSDEPCSYEETLRLKLFGARLRAEEAPTFPDCFVDVVRWDAFPVKVLRQLLAGELRVLEPLLGRPALGPAPERFREIVVESLAARCQRLEAHEPAAKRRRLCDSSAKQGAFARMKSQGIGVRVAFSSRCSHHMTEDNLLLFSKQSNFGTAAGHSSTNNPWISLTATGAMVRPEAIGFMHGYSVNSYQCQNFVVEGSVGGAVWTELLTVANEPLTEDGQLYKLAASEASSEIGSDERYFDSFRIRMTGPNTSGSWNLFVSWFDIFGRYMSKESAETARAIGPDQSS